MTSGSTATPGGDVFVATVTVRGEAVLAVEPDEATLSITLSALEPDPGTALADVAQRSEALVELLDEIGVAKADRSTSGVSVGEEIEHTQQGRRSLGHRATAQVSVRLTDPQVIGRLITQATKQLQARIDGPRWHIAANNPVRLEAARQAAAHGQRKAQAYADGVEAKLGRLMRLTETGLDVIERQAAARGAQATMPIEPGEHDVHAAIEITFALETT